MPCRQGDKDRGDCRPPWSPLAVAIADGSRHDSVLTERALDAAFVGKLPPRLIGDKAWDAEPLALRLAKERGIELIAPKRGGKCPSPRKQDLLSPGRSWR